MLQRAHLEIVDAIDRHSTITAAAEALHLTQSAVSHALRRLERLLDVRLTRPQGRRVRLTQAGTCLLAASRRILPGLKEADQVLAQFGSGERGRLRIGMECHPCYEWLLTVLGRFLDKRPHVDVDVVQRFQFNGMEGLRDHEIDVLVTPDPVVDEDLRFEPVFPYELLLVVDEGHPLAGRRRASPRDLASLQLLSYPVPPERLDVFTRFLMPAGVRPRSLRAVEATEVMLALVRAGRGVTTLPDWMMRGERAHGLSALRLGSGGIRKEISLGFRADEDLPGYVQDFVRLCRAPAHAGRPVAGQRRRRS
jgi:LysR family transcriptional regulator for metE and metH